jgi:chitin disaccharide deacetylase
LRIDLNAEANLSHSCGVEDAPRRLIVTADDFGLSSSTNHAIIQAHREGILTCASLMVNEPGFEEAVSLARANPRLGVGLHLTLLDGHSTLPPNQIPRLVNQRREFTRSPVIAGCRYFLFPWLRAQLRAEIKAQFARFRATGLPLDHVNSHHHLHNHRVLLGLLLEEAGNLGINRMRLPYEPIETARQLGEKLGATARLQIQYHARMSARARRSLEARIKHNDFMFGLSRMGEVDEAYLQRLLPALPRGVTEIYAHPSLDTFKHELQALLSPSVGQIVKNEGIHLRRFADL